MADSLLPSRVADPTANTTATTIAVPPIQSSSHLYDNWGVAHIIVAGAIATLGALGAIFALIGGIMNVIEKFKAGSREKLSPYNERLTALETTVKSFSPTELLERNSSRMEARIEHVKNNLQMQINGLSDRMRGAESNFHDLNLKTTRLEGKVDNCNDNTTRIGKAVDRLEEKIDEHFERMSRVITEHSPLHK